MNEIHPDGSLDLTLIAEKVKIANTLFSKFSRQAEQLLSLKRKIQLLQDELKKLEVNIKTQDKEINLVFKNINEETSLFQEAAVPDSDLWTAQHVLRNIEEQYHNFTNQIYQEMDQIK